MTGGAFGNFEPGHIDRMRDATVDILAANPRFAAWSGGRIRPVEFLALPPTITAPCILVGAISETPSFGVGCNEVMAPIGTVFYWRQAASFLDAGAASFAAVTEEWRRAMVANPYLLVPRFGGRQMTKRLNGLSVINYGKLEPDSNSAVLFVSLEAEYELDVNNRTWLPRGFENG